MASHNPLAGVLGEARSSLQKLQAARGKLDRDLRWHRSFTPAAASGELRALSQTQATLRGEAEAVQARREAAQRLVEQLAQEAALGWNPGYWFSSERSAAKRRHAEQRELVGQLVEEHRRLEGRAKAAAEQERRLEKELQRYGRIDPVRSQERLQQLDEEIALQQRKLATVQRRKDRVDQRLAPMLQQLRELERGQAELTARLEQARGFQRQLDRAANGYERRQVHERCEAQLGRGSPGSVVHEVERRRARLQRDIDKLQRRIEQEAEASARDVRGVVVDGNNLCYEDSTFIGLAALIPTCAALAGRYQVTVVFDPSIARHFAQEALRASLPQAKVHVVQSRRAADELILDVSRDRHVVVLSNDRFGEFRDKEAVRSGRLVRHDILNGRVSVPDLDVDVPFAQP